MLVFGIVNWEVCLRLQQLAPAFGLDISFLYHLQLFFLIVNIVTKNYYHLFLEDSVKDRSEH